MPDRQSPITGPDPGDTTGPGVEDPAMVSIAPGDVSMTDKPVTSSGNQAGPGNGNPSANCMANLREKYRNEDHLALYLKGKMYQGFCLWSP